MLGNTIYNTTIHNLLSIKYTVLIIILILMDGKYVAYYIGRAKTIIGLQLINFIY